MQNYNRAFLDRAAKAAEDAGCIFPTMAACEAALESGYGTSQLARNDNNLFGMKQHKHPIYGTHMLPTREFVNGSWIVTNAPWISYPDWPSCFKDRQDTLVRLSTVDGFEHYMDALNAPDCISYVKAVSASWSTDPHRADKVIAIYNMYMADGGSR
jgi:flagellum-specific peptidoglycan hydrolase FlgJ